MDYIADHVAEADLADWVTIAAYLIAAVLSWIATRRARAHGQVREGRFWLASVVAMLFFGMNELLDLQTLLTAMGKTLAQQQGWYDNRHIVQTGFIGVLAVMGLLTFLVAMRLTRGLSGTIKLAIAGYVFIAIFVMVRAASFHRVDLILGSGSKAFNYGSIQEMAGIVIVALASLSYARSEGSRGT